MKYILSLFMLSLSLASFSNPVTQVVVFGDSLSDAGNLYEYMNHQLPMSPPYFEGRFTNGPVWIEVLMQKMYPNDYTEHLFNYAYGGANVTVNDEDNKFSLENQLKKYFTQHETANPDALYVIWVGSNNYLDLPEDIPDTCNKVVNGIGNALESLVQKGAKRFILVNIPDLSTTPAAIEFDAVNDLKRMSEMHNTMLVGKVNQLKAKYPDVQWIEFDVADIMGDIISHPQAHGFKDGQHTCCEYMDNPIAQTTNHKVLSVVNAMAYAPTKGNDLCYDYLFFDLYHPTAHAHQLMAEEVYKLVLDKKFI